MRFQEENLAAAVRISVGHYFVFDDAKYDDDCDDFDDLGCGGVAVKAELQGSVSGWFPCAKQVINQFNQYVGIGIGIPR